MIKRNQADAFTSVLRDPMQAARQTPAPAPAPAKPAPVAAKPKLAPQAAAAQQES